MKKLIALIALTLVSLSALAQTSSRFRNEVVTNVTEHEQRIRNSCVALANRQYHAQDVRLNSPRSWLYTYEVKFLNDCYFNVKMRLMDKHAQLLRGRIATLRRTRADARDIRLLQDGLKAFLEQQATERRRFVERDYGWLGQDNITELLLREIKKVLNAHYEMRAEMRWEGTL